MLQYKIEPNYNAVNHFFLCALAIAAQGKFVLESKAEVVSTCILVAEILVCRL
jgi:hypothetical protein